MTERILLGTYTRGKSQGIYETTLDSDLALLSPAELIAEVGNPTYLTTHPTLDIIYAIVNEEDRGGVVALTPDEKGRWQRVSEVTAPGAAPCYVAYDAERELLYTANYHKGTVDVYRTDGAELTLVDTVTHEGHSTHPNQDRPHAHYADLTPDKQFVVACDLGTDEVYTYTVNEQGKLTEHARLEVADGTGPRHLAFHPTLPLAYLFGELSSEILTLSYDADAGTFDVIDTQSTLPTDYTEENSGAALRLTQDGRFLYASNRGHNSIICFKVDPSGQLTPAHWTPTLGDGPRDFNLNRTDDFLLVGHQHTDHLTLFKRDATTGELTPAQKEVYAPEVVNVHF